MKKVLFLVLFSILTGNVFSQEAPKTVQPKPVKSFNLLDYGVRIEADKRLISVMSALEAGGIETNLGDEGTDFRKRLKADLAPIDEKLKNRIKAFYNSYKSRQPATATTGELLAPFVSLAYALDKDLIEPKRSLDLPADLLEVLDFAVYVRDFSRQSGIAGKLDEYAKLYQAEGDKMEKSVNEMVGNLLSYLNTRPITVTIDRVKVEVPNSKKKISRIETIQNERRFFIVPDLLATAGTVNFRNIRDDYYAIVPPNTNFRVSEVRRAYLQFIVDPLILKNAKEIAALRPAIKDLLDERRKENPDVSPDVFLATMRSLVAAIDAKQLEFQKTQTATDLARRKIEYAKTADAKKAVSAQLEKDKQDFAAESIDELAQAYERGAVLAFYFAGQLNGIEDSGFSIDGSLNQMILGIETTREKNRLAESAEARKRVIAIREERKKNAAAINAKQDEAIARAKDLKVKLDPIEALIKNKQFTEADTTLKKLLGEYPGEESSIYYVLGRNASLSAASGDSGGAGTFDETLRDKRLEDAKLFYSNAIRSANENTDPALVQLAYYSLGRIFEFYEDNNYAIQIYQTALKYGNIRGGAYNESIAAISRLSQPKQPK